MVWRFDVGVGGDMVVVVVLVLVAEWGETCGVVFEHHQCQYQIQHIAWRPSSLPLIECHSPQKLLCCRMRGMHHAIGWQPLPG